MATHSSVLAWRIPGTGEPGGLPSMGSHRVGHDLAAAAAVLPLLLLAAGSPARSVSWVGSRWGSLLPSTCLSGPLRSFWRRHPFPVQLGPASRDPFPQSLSCWPHLRLALLCPGRQGACVRCHSCCGSRSGLPSYPLAPPSPSLGLGLSQSFHPGVPAPFFFPTFFFKAQLILTSS